MRATIFLMRSRVPAQNENTVPFVPQMPLALKNKITGKGGRNAERGCLYEISLVLRCLAQSNFEDKLCTKEVKLFQDCYRTNLSNISKSKEHARKGILTPNTKDLKYNQINILLKKYPHS